MNETRRVFQFVLNGTQEECMKFIERIEFPLEVRLAYKAIKPGEAKCSIYCPSQSSYVELYKKIDDIIVDYII